MKTTLALLTLALLTGCPALSDYDRTLGIVANVNEQTGAIEYEIRPAVKKGEGTLGGRVRIEGAISDGKQVISLER